MKPYWDKNKGVYIVECFNLTHEFGSIDQAWDYITEVNCWMFSDPI